MPQCLDGVVHVLKHVQHQNERIALAGTEVPVKRTDVYAVTKGIAGVDQICTGLDALDFAKFTESLEEQRISATNVQDVFPTLCWSQLTEFRNDQFSAKTLPPVPLEEFAICFAVFWVHRESKTLEITARLSPILLRAHCALSLRNTIVLCHVTVPSHDFKNHVVWTALCFLVHPPRIFSDDPKKEKKRLTPKKSHGQDQRREALWRMVPEFRVQRIERKHQRMPIAPAPRTAAARRGMTEKAKIPSDASLSSLSGLNLVRPA